MCHIDIGHLSGHRHKIIGHGAVAKRPTLVIEAFLEKHAADPLNDRSANLLIYQHGIDDSTAILDDPMLKQSYHSSFDVNFDMRYVYAVCEYEGIVTLGVMARRG